jgi:hypothetical protein
MPESDVAVAVATMVEALAKADYTLISLSPRQQDNKLAILDMAKYWLSPDSNAAIALNVFAQKFERKQIHL